jgi:hypothetical protein
MFTYTLWHWFLIKEENCRVEVSISVTEEYYYNSVTPTFRKHMSLLSAGSKIKPIKKCQLVSRFCWLFAYLTPPKRRAVPKLHGLTILRTLLLITSVMITSDLTALGRSFLPQDRLHKARLTCAVSQNGQTDFTHLHWTFHTSACVCESYCLSLPVALGTLQPCKVLSHIWADSHIALWVSVLPFSVLPDCRLLLRAFRSPRGNAQNGTHVSIPRGVVVCFFLGMVQIVRGSRAICGLRRNMSVAFLEHNFLTPLLAIRITLDSIS